MIGMIISSIHLNKNDTEQTWYSQSRINRSHLQNTHSSYLHLLVYINRDYEYNTHT
jgi:hypothetical protein